ncbi:MAG: TerC family protein [Planctomycetota bacterium]|nr:TerC family protein [Planctomycetota bacterium]
MPDVAQTAAATPPMAWAVFGLIVFVILGADLFYFNRRPHVAGLFESTVWAAVCVAAALGFNVGVYFWKGPEAALKFATVYVLEESLSVDNLFIFLLIFTYFKVPVSSRHRVLFWGILGAIAMRGVLITAGVALVQYFNWLLFLFGAILIYSGAKLVFSKEEAYEPSQTLVFRLTKKYLPVTEQYDGAHFLALENGRRLGTPLLMVLIMIETADLVFAVDSIPACLGQSQDPFIVLTSNIFAVMGLRALYFVIAGLMGSIRYLRPALALVLLFIGVKMLWEESRKHDFLPAGWGERLEITTGMSLAVVAAILGIAVVASFLRPKPAEDK